MGRSKCNVCEYDHLTGCAGIPSAMIDLELDLQPLECQISRENGEHIYPKVARRRQRALKRLNVGPWVEKQKLELCLRRPHDRTLAD